MRAFFVIVAWLVLMSSIGLAEPKTIRIETLIRRAYIDISGHVPTIEEIDWYCVYNQNNSYELAVDTLLSRSWILWKQPKHQIKRMLMSEGYKNQDPVPVDMKLQLIYIVGMGDVAATPENVERAKKKLIEFAIMSSNNSDEIIDYMCNALMSRSSNLKEANMLSSKFTQTSRVVGDDAAWMLILNDILQLDDVKTK
jgi:hypothetical protein